MENLFKIDKIDGKGLGWIALQDIKSGTLIYKEKPQFSPHEHDDMLSHFVVFQKMSQNDQEEFLNLPNAFSDPNSLNDEMKKCYFDWKNKASDGSGCQKSGSGFEFFFGFRSGFEIFFGFGSG